MAVLKANLQSQERRGRDQILASDRLAILIDCMHGDAVASRRVFGAISDATLWVRIAIHRVVRRFLSWFRARQDFDDRSRGFNPAIDTTTAMVNSAEVHRYLRRYPDSNRIRVSMSGDLPGLNPSEEANSSRPLGRPPATPRSQRSHDCTQFPQPQLGRHESFRRVAISL